LFDEPVTAQLAPQSIRSYAQGAGGFFLVAAIFFQRAQNVAPLHLG